MKRIASITLGLLLACANAFASEAPAEKKVSTAVPQTATLLQVAGQLVKYGYSEDLALPLIQAADIYQSIGHKKSTLKPEGERSAIAAADKKDSRVSFDPERLLVDASMMAGGDPTLLSLIDDVRRNANRGATSYYEVTSEYVRALETDSYQVEFRGGEIAIVVVSGDGDTDLDLYIYDPAGNLVCSDTDNTDDCVCVWTPRTTATYTIMIKNYGQVYNQYQISVN